MMLKHVLSRLNRFSSNPLHPRRVVDKPCQDLRGPCVNFVFDAHLVQLLVEHHVAGALDDQNRTHCVCVVQAF